ncbi:MAG TPA: hypothetical protein VNH82_05820 [Candidatus Dormibacteraeota bacterium]|nr:hypothetical protein [Candidatus Dormibacteraeota bacterium]HVC22926.1 hypothetical protein [Candidatus Dormibacteraeota bacterium]
MRHIVVPPVLTPKVVAQLGATPKPRPPLEPPHGANRSSFDHPGSRERPAESCDHRQLVRGADIHLTQLMRNVEHPISTPRWHKSIYWMVCADFGALVFRKLFGPEGAGECEDGGLPALARHQGARAISTRLSGPGFAEPAQAVPHPGLGLSPQATRHPAVSLTRRERQNAPLGQGGQVWDR